MLTFNKVPHRQKLIYIKFEIRGIRNPIYCTGYLAGRYEGWNGIINVSQSWRMFSGKDDSCFWVKLNYVWTVLISLWNAATSLDCKPYVFGINFSIRSSYVFGLSFLMSSVVSTSFHLRNWGVHRLRLMAWQMVSGKSTCHLNPCKYGGRRVWKANFIKKTSNALKEAAKEIEHELKKLNR